MQRRSFLVGTSALIAGCRALRFRPDTPQPLDDHERDTLAAMAETFLPGDDGTPGAHDANALATIVDPAYGLLPYLSELVSDLDQWCLATKHLAFKGLSASDRELVLEQRMGLHGKLIQSLYKPAYEGALALTKLAFFGGLANALGTSYAAFPGASRGYAPASAAGAWASLEAPWPIELGRASAIRVDGAGLATTVHASVFATTDDDLRATLRVRAPDGKRHDLPLRVSGAAETGRVHGTGEALVDVALPLAGGPAAGDWRLEIAAASGAGRVELWALRLRTDLDDRAASGGRRPT